LHVTAHAGEWCGAESIRRAIESLHITRLGHGVRSIEDPSLIRDIVAEDIHLEICPMSNVRLGVYENLTSHPLPRFLQAGVSFSLNTDDPPFFGTTLDYEYQLAAEKFGFSEEQLLATTREAIRHSFAEPELKHKLLAGLSSC